MFAAWTPEGGVQNFFLTTQIVAGQTTTTYKESTRYQFEGGKWAATALPEPLQGVLDANLTGSMIAEAIPDTGCCGWSNQSNDQTLVLTDGKTHTIFDEQVTYKNADYDVSFFTMNARLSPDAARVAMFQRFHTFHRLGRPGFRTGVSQVVALPSHGKTAGYSLMKHPKRLKPVKPDFRLLVL